jgi:DNA end-binding protein Ku
MNMALQLIDSLTAEWEPEKYTDEYRDNLMKVIRAKLKGRAPTLHMTEEPQSAEVVDLMERLRRSLEGAGGGGRKTAKSGAKPSSKARPKKAPAARAKKKRAA